MIWQTICSDWIADNLTIAQKMACVDCGKQPLVKYDGVASKDRFNIVTADESCSCAYEPETKQQCSVWVFEPEPNRTKIVCGKITSRQMVDCFFGKTGHVATVPLENRRTVNYELYTTICLRKVFGEIRKINNKIRIIDSSSHTSAQTSAFLSGQNVELMGHPPYSPDLASNDLFLFQQIKKKYTCSTIFVARRCCSYYGRT